jgi:phosphoglycerol transferase MdoB-like AlkP superfamily enzyme
MKKYNLLLSLYMFISFIFVEILFKVITFNNLLDIELIRIILFNLSTALLLGYLFSFFKRRTASILMLITVFVSGLYVIIQLGFKNFMGNYMSLNAAGDGAGRVTEYVIEFIKYIKPIYYLSFLPFIILSILVIFKKDKLVYVKQTPKVRLIFAILIVVVHTISLSTLVLPMMQNKTQIKSNIKLYYEPTLIELGMKEFGTNRFFFRDIVYMFKPHNNTNEIIIEEKEEVVETDYTRYIDDSNWISLKEKETNSSIKKADEFFLNQNITDKNDYTGIFKDKNLILIMVEAFDDIAIKENVTPTLWKMKTEGLFFNNYYAPKYSCTTGESEYIGLTSIIPAATVCTPNAYRNNVYSETMFNLFNRSGYYSSSYHNWNDQFYNRSKLHINMGSKQYLDVDGLKINIIGGWQSDHEMMEKALPYFVNQEKFFSFIITSSTHFPYDVDSTLTRRNWDKVKDLPYPTHIKRYLAKAVELDKAMEYLLKELENKGILDDTVIVMFGDHHPLKTSYAMINEASSYNRTEDFNIDKLPFIIYNAATEPQVISTTASTFDIVPTVANLFDLDYDPRLYVGKDILSDDEKIVIFSNGSWITDKAIYYSSKGTFKALQEGIDENYISATNQKVNNYFTVSDIVLTKDYYKYRKDR